MSFCLIGENILFVESIWRARHGFKLFGVVVCKKICFLNRVDRLDECL